MLGNGISLIWSHFYSCLLSNRLFAKQFSNFSNSLNFEAKINCNTSKPNVPKCRKTCTGIKCDCTWLVLDCSWLRCLFWEIMGTRSVNETSRNFTMSGEGPYLLRAYSLLKSPTGAVIEEFIKIFCCNQSIINFTDKHPILLLRPRFKRVFSIVS